jgi:hypothetical protein
MSLVELQPFDGVGAFFSGQRGERAGSKLLLRHNYYRLIS